MTTNFNLRAGDDIHWRRYNMASELRYQTEQKNAFSASGRWTILAGATEYVEFRIPVGVVVRVYSRLTAVETGLFNVDLCSATSITSGTIELSHTNMDLTGNLPLSRIFRNTTNVAGLSVKEFSMVPSAKGPQSSGAFQAVSAERIIRNTSVPPLLRIQNTGNADSLFDLIVIWTELEF